MTFWRILCISALMVQAAFAQQKQYQGIVFDKQTNERIARVNIVNLTTGTSVYNNLKAEFSIAALPGDVLVLSKTGYLNDTLKLAAVTTVAVFLKPTSILLHEVTVNERVNPTEKFEATKRDFTKVYGNTANHDLLNTNSSGVGLSIDGLYNMFSFSGRNATRLRAIIERDYHEDVIDSRFNLTLVGSVTGLKQPQLSDFMFKYRPSYYFTRTANDYDFIRYIRQSLKRYKRNPDAFQLQPLVNP